MPQPKPPKAPQSPPPSSGNAAQAELRGVDLAINLVVSVLVAGGAGYALDRWLGSLPAFMLLGGALGFAAWMRMVWQMMKRR